jgi:hypothetical protein
MPRMVAAVEPTASSTAAQSCSQCSTSEEPASDGRSESPAPRRSNRIKREKDASRRKKRVIAGVFPLDVQVAPEPGRVDEIPRPLTHDLVGDAIVADGGELGFWLDHGRVGFY